MFKPTNYKSFSLFFISMWGQDTLVDKISSEILSLSSKYPNEWLEVRNKHISIFFKNSNHELVIIFNGVEYTINHDLDSIKNCFNEIGVE